MVCFEIINIRRQFYAEDKHGMKKQKIMNYSLVLYATQWLNHKEKYLYIHKYIQFVFRANYSFRLMNNQFPIRAKPIFKLNGNFEFTLCLDSVIDDICIDVYSWQFFLMNTNIGWYLCEVENIKKDENSILNCHYNLPIIKKLSFQIGNPENLIMYTWDFCKE